MHEHTLLCYFLVCAKSFVLKTSPLYSTSVCRETPLLTELVTKEEGLSLICVFRDCYKAPSVFFSLSIT